MSSSLNLHHMWPVPAIEKLLARTGLTIPEIDYLEVNEAFAVVNLHVEAQLGSPRDRRNLYGAGQGLAMLIENSSD